MSSERDWLEGLRFEDKFPNLLQEVVDDLRERSDAGKREYGVRLHPFNGRDPLQDAYEEALDLCMYLKQAIVERAIERG